MYRVDASIDCIEFDMRDVEVTVMSAKFIWSKALWSHADPSENWPITISHIKCWCCYSIYEKRDDLTVQKHFYSPLCQKRSPWALNQRVNSIEFLNDSQLFYTFCECNLRLSAGNWAIGIRSHFLPFSGCTLRLKMNTGDDTAQGQYERHLSGCSYCRAVLSSGWTGEGRYRRQRISHNLCNGYRNELYCGRISIELDDLNAFNCQVRGIKLPCQSSNPNVLLQNHLVALLNALRLESTTASPDQN